MEPYVIFNSISVSIIICGIIYYTINELPSCITGSGIIEPFNTPTYIVHTPPNKTLDNKYDDFFTDILSESKKKKLEYLFDELINYMEKRNITYILAFGSLLGAVRHGFRMPWDDDIDIMISGKDVKKFISGLRLKGRHFSSLHYFITPKIYIVYKEWGVPIKFKLIGEKYPFIDIFTYNSKDEYIIIPPKQMKSNNGVFEELKTDIFPLKHANFENRLVNIPKNYKKILQKKYGPDVLQICKRTHDHSTGAQLHLGKWKIQATPTKHTMKRFSTRLLSKWIKNFNFKIDMEINIKDLDKKYLQANIFD